MVLVTDLKLGDLFVYNGRVLQVARTTRGWVAAVDAAGAPYNLRRGTAVELPTRKQKSDFPKVAKPYVKGVCPKCGSSDVTHGVPFTDKNGRSRRIRMHIRNCQVCATRFDFNTGSTEDLHDELPIMRTTAEKFKAARERYKERGDGFAVSCGDPVAEKLYFMSLDQIYDAASKVLRVPVGQLYDRYSKLNPGMQRMNLGNRLRANLAAYEYFGIPFPK